MFKPEIRIIAWDDCAFRFGDRKVLLVGAIFRGGKFMDGLLSTVIKKDGTDATWKISRSILSSRHYDQLSLVMLNGISFGGLNIVDIKALHEKTKLPVIAVMRKKPDIEAFLKAMKRLDGYKKRGQAVRNAGAVYEHQNLFYQSAGFSRSECGQIFKMTCTQSNIPEPLRAAHLIASGLSRSHGSGYESRGRA